jgi:hypothetical protein
LKRWITRGRLEPGAVARVGEVRLIFDLSDLLLLSARAIARVLPEMAMVAESRGQRFGSEGGQREQSRWSRRAGAGCVREQVSDLRAGDAVWRDVGLC